MIENSFQNPRAYYQSRLDFFEEDIANLSKKDKYFTTLRILVFFGGCAVSIFFLLSKSSFLIWTSLFFIGVYLFLFKRHEGLKKLLDLQIRIKKLNTLEFNALNGDISQFKNGEAYFNSVHDYSADLDIFGDKSIFQYINRTVSRYGSDVLASWFLKPASLETIKSRQKSARELAQKTLWMEEFRSVNFIDKESTDHLQRFFYWLNVPSEINFSKPLLFFIKSSPVILGISCFFVLVQLIAPDWVALHPSYFWKISALLSPWFFLNLGITGIFTKRINKAHQLLSGQSATLFSYSDFIQKVENEPFTSEALIALQGVIKDTPAASKVIRKLSIILEKFDGRLNLLVTVFTNGIYLSDLRLAYELDNWKSKNSLLPPVWIKAIAEMEAFISLGMLAFNEENWVFPVPDAVQNSIKASQMGHPLIPVQKRILNSCEILPPNQVILVTGSNMAGKSTFLRTLGVNLVLAQLGSKVCAESFHFKPTSIYTSLRIADSLQENTSSFYAELKRLEVLIKRTKEGEPIFFLLDEILRGTNSNDRHLGSKAVLKHLINAHSFGVLATHDLSLGELENIYPNQLKNMHFDVTVKGEELYFDYTLKSGICTSLNASILMRKIGLDIDTSL